VDDEDYEALTAFRWCADVRQGGDRAVAVRNAPRPERGLIYMHNVILPPPDGLEVDHRQHQSGVVDNRRGNLRLVTRQQNAANARKRKGASSRYKGVSWHRHGQRWRAYIRVGGCSMHLGYWSDEVQAAKSYDRAAAQHFGEHALTNFDTPGAGRSLYGVAP
jgi:hypothetical protein